MQGKANVIVPAVCSIHKSQGRKTCRCATAVDTILFIS